MSKGTSTGWLLVGSAVYRIVVALLDLHFLPVRNLPIRYTVPVLLASFTASALLVVAMSALVILLDLLSVLVEKTALVVWPLTFVSLLVVCFLAFQVAGQRAFIRRHVEETARGRWIQLLLGEVAHELRPPLTVILGYTQPRRLNPNLPGPLQRPVAGIDGVRATDA